MTFNLVESCNMIILIENLHLFLQFVNDGGFSSGISGISGLPTRTTSTLTPTTLRNIEQVRNSRLELS